MKKLVLCLLSLTLTCCTAFAAGTPNYAVLPPTISSAEVADTDCAVVGGTKNCWHQFADSTSPAIADWVPGKITVGFSDGPHTDEEVYVLDNSGVIHKTELNNTSWSTVTLTGAPSTIKQIHVGQGGINDLYVTAGSTGEVWHYNGSSWTDLNLAVGGGQFCVGQFDESVFAVSGGVLEQYTGTSWTDVTTPTGHGDISQIACGQALNLWLLMSDGTVWNDVTQSTITFTQQSIPSITIKQMIAWGQYQGALLSSAGSNDIYLYKWTNGSWVNETGYLTNIGPTAEYPIGYLSSGTGKGYFHLAPLKYSITSNINGNYDCTGFPGNQCPNGSMHTGESIVTFTSGGNNADVFGTPVQPASDLAVYATGTTEDCDPFTNPNGDPCSVSTTGKVACSVMGAIVSIPTWIKQFWIKPFDTYVYLQGPPQVVTGGFSYANVDDCDSLSDPPMCPANGNSGGSWLLGFTNPPTHTIRPTNSSLNLGLILDYRGAVDANGGCQTVLQQTINTGQYYPTKKSCKHTF